ncbi:hypothetical protein NPIL_24591 [Nephila pilipes]|uniref:Uncharacterized protein n=1 Tax=Nephila pilipes TaxID=299642 RepID=A0A8X6QWE1_NEPPI|nr:hypothetical protein NPIL_24591 [Nephila pilipes]
MKEWKRRSVNRLAETKSLGKKRTLPRKERWGTGSGEYMAGSALGMCGEWVVFGSSGARNDQLLLQGSPGEALSVHPNGVVYL